MNIGQNSPRIDPNLNRNLNLIQGLNINVAAQNPHEAEMREQFALQQIAAQANKEGAEKVNNAFQDFAEETRKNYAAVAERCKQLEEKLVTQEADAKLQQEALLNIIKKSAEAIEQLSTSLEKTNLAFATLQKNAGEQIKALTERYEGHGHNYGYYLNNPVQHRIGGTGGPNK